MANVTLTDARVRALTPPQSRIRHPRRKAQGVRRPGAALRTQAILRPLPAPGGTGLEDRRRRRDRERRRCPVPRRRDARRDTPRRECDAPTRRGALRGRCRDRVPAPRAALENEHAQGEPGVSAQPAHAEFRGAPDCGHRPAGRPQLVRRAPCNPGRRRQVHAGALRDHEGGGSDGSPARRLQPVPWHPALPPEGAASASWRTGRCAGSGRHCRIMRIASRWRWPPSVCFF